jgi:hypothetical protein
MGYFSERQSADTTAESGVCVTRNKRIMSNSDIPVTGGSCSAASCSAWGEGRKFVSAISMICDRTKECVSLVTYEDGLKTVIGHPKLADEFIAEIQEFLSDVNRDEYGSWESKRR